MSGARTHGEIWASLTAFSDAYTCYSSAVATWVAVEDSGWARVVNPGLCLTVTEAGGGLFGFAHFPPALRARLGLARRGADVIDDAVEGVGSELAASGRVIVAGDGFNLPWHVAFERRHVPHWFVLVGNGNGNGNAEGEGGGAAVVDPFACRNELGVQTATRHAVEPGQLEALLPALPPDDPVLMLRELLALGDVAEPPAQRGHQWFVRGEVGATRAPHGFDGGDAALRLARHFRETGQEPSAYAQADDLWSIARHRAFLARLAAAAAERGGVDELAAWASQHAAPLAARWGHIAPLVMQATLALGAGRAASASVPDTLEALAELERTAATAFPAGAAAASPADLGDPPPAGGA